MPPRARPAGPLTHAEAREQIHYDPLTGICTWLVSKPRVTKGMRASNLHVKGYRHITICGREYKEHVFIWFWMTGEWPDHIVDHRNLTRDDNRWENLRPATHSQNQMNSARYGAERGIQIIHTSKGPKYRARLRGKLGKHLGYFKDKAEALEAYRQAAIAAYGEFYYVHES